MTSNRWIIAIAGTSVPGSRKLPVPGQQRTPGAHASTG